MVYGIFWINLMVVGILKNDSQKHKAVSTFIASVILILITIVIGSYLAYWSQDFAKGQTEVVSENVKSECTYVYINAQDIQYDNTTEQLSFLVQNTGTSNTQITNIQIFYDNFTQQTIPDIFPMDLEAGNLQPFRFDASENIKYVQIISSCPDKSIKLYESDIDVI
ncbi:MAG: hypothetical protein U9P44_02060 [archaeon]|nr:hypothetical protein [archaeon]